MDTYFKALKQILEGKDEITFLSGAGLSTSAGLPDFRSDENGFWKSNSPVHFRDFLSSKEYRMKSWQNNIAIHKKLENIKPTKMHNLVNKSFTEEQVIFILLKILMDCIEIKLKKKILLNCMAVFLKPNVFNCEAEYDTLEYFDNLELDTDCSLF